jgi:hypothetical protein
LKRIAKVLVAVALMVVLMATATSPAFAVTDNCQKNKAYWRDEGKCEFWGNGAQGEIPPEYTAKGGSKDPSVQDQWGHGYGNEFFT